MRKLPGALALLALAHCESKVELDCTSEPELAGTTETGFATCGDLLHRPAVEVCDVTEHTEAPACGENEDSACATDEECVDGALGRCDDPGTGACACSYGCANDEDCNGRVCRCGADRGACIEATCLVDADCADEGALCVFSITDPCDGGTPPRFACLSTRDQCTVDGACDEDERCVLGIDGVRTCQLADRCPFPQ